MSREKPAAVKLLRTPIGDCVDDDSAPEVEMVPFDEDDGAEFLLRQEPQP